MIKVGKLLPLFSFYLVLFSFASQLVVSAVEEIEEMQRVELTANNKTKKQPQQTQQLPRAPAYTGQRMRRREA